MLLNNTRNQALIAGVLIVAFTALGLWYGAPPDAIRAGDFGGVLRAFAQEQQTRTILSAILIDVVTGVIAALRLNIFSGERLAGFLQTNVLPYLLGYMLLWFLSYFGSIDLLPVAVTNSIASLGYGAVMATLTVSILDNLARAKAGSTPPHDAIQNDLPPAEPHA